MRLACIDSWPRVCVVLPFLETCSQDSSKAAPWAASAQHGDGACSGFQALGLAVDVQSLSMLLYITCLPVSHNQPHQDVRGFEWQESSPCEGCRASPLTEARQLLKHADVLRPTRGLHVQQQSPTADCSSRNVLNQMLSCSHG